MRNSLVGMIFFTGLYLFTNSPVFASSAQVQQIEAPRYLYSWVRLSALRKMFEKDPTGQVVNFFNSLDPADNPAGKQSAFIQKWPQLKRRNAVFTWINPALSPVGSASGEEYGEILVRFELRKDSTAFRLTSSDSLGMQYRQQMDSLPQGVGSADLIFNKDGIQEWILLSPHAVEKYTMDPEEMRPFLERQIERLTNPNEKFGLDELHAMSFDQAIDPTQPTFGSQFNERKYSLFRLQQFLKMGRSMVPLTYLKSEFNGQVSRAQKGFEENLLAIWKYKENEKAVRDQDEMISRISWSKNFDLGTLKYYLVDVQDANTFLSLIDKIPPVLTARLAVQLGASGDDPNLLKSDLKEWMRPLRQSFSKIYEQVFKTGQLPAFVDIYKIDSLLRSIGDFSKTPVEVLQLCRAAFPTSEAIEAMLTTESPLQQKVVAIKGRSTSTRQRANRKPPLCLKVHGV